MTMKPLRILFAVSLVSLWVAPMAASQGPSFPPTFIEVTSTSLSVTGQPEHGFGFVMRGVDGGSLLGTFPGLDGIPGNGDIGDGVEPDSFHVLMVTEPFPGSDLFFQPYGNLFWSMEGVPTPSFLLLGDLLTPGENELADEWGFSADMIGSPLGSANGQLVGVLGNPAHGFGSGAIRVNTRMPSDPGIVPAFDVASSNTFEAFGYAVALMGDMDGTVTGSSLPAVSLDGSEVVIGAPRFGSGAGDDIGRITIYRLPDTNTIGVSVNAADVVEDVETAIGEKPGDWFGSNVAMVLATANRAWFLVSAPRWDGSNGVNSGRVYLYQMDVQTDGNYDLTELTAGSPIEGEAAFDQFGATLGRGGDLDGDPTTIEVLVGVPVAGQDPNEFGKVYGYQVNLSEDPVTITLAFVVTGENTGDLFGSSAVVVGDLYASGRNDFMVGAPAFDGVAGSNCGKIYAYTWNGQVEDGGAVPFGSTTSLTMELEGLGASEGFGWALAPLGDYDVGSVGSGTFLAAPTTSSNPIPGIDRVGVIDFNEDTVLDLVVTDNTFGADSPTVFLGNSVAGIVDIDGGGLGDGEFETASTPALPSLGGPQAGLAVGTWIGPNPDILVSLPNTDELALIDGQGSSGFAATVVNISVGDTPGALAVDDWDKDGLLDAAVINTGATDVTILEGTPGVGLVNHETIEIFGVPTAITAGLWSNDGSEHTDLIVAVAGGELRLLNNTEADTSALETPAFALAFWDQTRAMDLGDVDGDSDLDLVVGADDGPGGGGQVNYLYLNDGTGQFRSAGKAQFPLDYDSTRAVVFAEFDATDGIDLFVGNFDSQNQLFLNNGTGTFTEATTNLPVGTDNTLSVAVGDFNNDDELDIVIGNDGANQLLLNSSSNPGNFSAATGTNLSTATDRTNAVGVGDFDEDSSGGDPDLDIFFGNDGQNRVFENTNFTGSGTFTDQTAVLPVATEDTLAVAVADFSGDGDLDIFLANDGQNTLLVGHPTTDFDFLNATAGLPSDTDTTRAVGVGDFDGDGELDLLLGNSGQNRIYQNNGAGGTFTDVTSSDFPVVSDETFAVAVGSIMVGAGDLDLVVGNDRPTFDDPNRLYANDGAGLFTDSTDNLPSDPKAGNGPVALVTADYDGDGNLDIAVLNAIDATVSILLGDSLGNFTDAIGSPISVEPAPSTMAEADWNEDGNPDLVVLTSVVDTGVAEILTNNGLGLGTFTVSQVADVSNAREVAVDDFNEDGVSDLLVVRPDDLDVYFGISLDSGDEWFVASAPFSEGDTANIVNKGVVRFMKNIPTGFVAPLVMGFDKDLVPFCHEGQLLTIKGQDLQEGGVILVDGKPLTEVVKDPITGDLTGKLPPFEAPGIKSVEVMNPDAGSFTRVSGLWVTPVLQGTMAGTGEIGGAVLSKLIHHETANALMLVSVGDGGSWYQAPGVCYDLYVSGLFLGALPLGIVGPPEQASWNWGIGPLPGVAGMILDLQVLMLPMAGGPPALSNLVQVRL